MIKKVVIYIRVSTQEQAQEGYSVQAQRERLINYCKAKGWVIQAIYVDPGYTGSNLDRPGMQSMIENIKSIDVVLVYKLDRLSRSQKDTLYLIEDVFLKNGVDFVSMNESFDTSTPFGRAMIGILSVFAQLEREQIKERSLMGRIERAKEGLYHGGWNTPIGYKYIPEKSELVVDEYEALQVKKIYQMYLYGESLCEIRKYMHNNGYKTKYGNYMHVKTIRNILSSVVYTGKIVFRDEAFDGKHEPIVSVEDFERVQKRLSIRKELNFKQHTSKALLQGLIYCDKCGARYSYKYNGRNYCYYTCYSRSKRQGHMIKDINCKNRNWKIEELDGYVQAEILKLASDKSYIESLFKNKNGTKSSISDYTAINKKISTIDKQISKLMDLYSMDTIPVEELSFKIESLHTEKKLLESKLCEYSIEQPVNVESLENIWVMLQGVKSTWNEMNRDEKRTVLQSLIKRILLNEKDIKIEWAFL